MNNRYSSRDIVYLGGRCSYGFEKDSEGLSQKNILVLVV